MDRRSFFMMLVSSLGFGAGGYAQGQGAPDFPYRAPVSSPDWNLQDKKLNEILYLLKKIDKKT